MNLIIGEKNGQKKRSRFRPPKFFPDAFLLGFDNFSGENSLLNFGRLNVFNCVVKGGILPKKIC